MLDVSWSSSQLAHFCASTALLSAMWPTGWPDVVMCLTLITGVTTLADLRQFRCAAANWRDPEGSSKSLVVVSYEQAQVEMTPVEVSGRTGTELTERDVTAVRIEDAIWAGRRSGRTAS